MKQYQELLQDVLDNGEYVEDRTGTGCYSLFGHMMRFDLSKGFPVVTTKKVNISNVIGELLFFTSGKTDLPSLRRYSDKAKDSHTIWSEDFNKFWEAKVKADPCRYDLNHPDQNLGAIYSQQWRAFHIGDTYEGHRISHDQITTLIDNIKDVVGGNHRQARRLIVTAWNPYDHTVGEKVTCALSSCHDSFQCIVRNGKLNLRFHVRSNDVFLGCPYNIAFYAAMCHVLAKLTGLEVGELVYMGTDVHLYSNHVQQACLQLSRKPYDLPKLVLPEFETLDELLQLTAKDFILKDYKCHDFIKAPQAS